MQTASVERVSVCVNEGESACSEWSVGCVGIKARSE